MTESSQTDQLLIDRIRAKESDAWTELIARFEGRLLAFVKSRANSRPAAEDIVQETFIGFLTSLPNYDKRRSLEGYLFSIAAHKLTDHLRREGRRPTIPLVSGSGSSGTTWDQPGDARPASSIVRSDERRHIEESALVEGMRQQIERWRQRGDWLKLKCIELLMVRGRPNKEVAAELGLSEQTVANHKFQFLSGLRGSVRKQELPEEVFPELYASE
ncbi:MAG: sigma-70 family RNA polymerase sigma factor [Pirellulales bacterium]|nr:sigma-70 family RNA polymerase sigma factor [Pirellulales bacterium]